MSIIADIINIGNELLIGQVINSNAASMAIALNSIGIDVQNINIISDNKKSILDALKTSLERSQIVLITGGLGPTNDDITKIALCDFFKSKLAFSQDAFSDIEQLFALRHFPITESNRQQAFLPDNCISIPNTRGTARGMWFEKDEKIVIAMPGVPFEMTEMLERYVIPMLQQQILSKYTILHQTMMCAGIGESFLADKISEWEAHLPVSLSLAYLPSPGIVRLRITGKSENALILKKEMSNACIQLKMLISEYIFDDKDISMEAFIVETLTNKNLTVATAESCTGGYIAHLLTSVAGSSQCFKGSVVAYNNNVKASILDVPETMLQKHGAVSEEVVKSMAEQVRKKMRSDFGIATSGIAGPSGGTEIKPVGTVWIAVSNGETTIAKCCHFSNDRLRNIQRSAIETLNLLRLNYL
jgi:nicotinamide-nucleotide amidase